MLKRLQSWLKVAPARLVNCLAYAMLGLAVILIVIGAIVLLTGQAGGLNNWLANSAGLFGSPVYHPDTSPEVMVGIMDNFYPGILTFVAIMFFLGGVVVVVMALSALAWLGHVVVNLVKSLAGQSRQSMDYLIAFVVWSVAIIVLWLLLNINTTIYWLLAGCGCLVVNILLLLLAGRLVYTPSSIDPGEDASEQPAKEVDES